MNLKYISSFSKIINMYFLILCLNKCQLSATKIYYVENAKVCSPISKKTTITLGKHEESAAIVTEKRYFDTWSGDDSFTCKFRVEAYASYLAYLHHNEGIIAVIQNLTLRKDVNTGECIDYIQFEMHNSTKSKQFCGEISSLVPDFEIYNSSIFSPNAFVEPSGRIEVLVYIGKQRLEPRERIDFSIAFTAYKSCSLKSRNTYEKCDYDVNNAKYCIWKYLFNDGIVNCPFYTCVDEKGCKLPNIVDHGNGAAVAVSALATVFLIFAFFLGFLWIVRKLHILCWKPRLNTSQATPVVLFSEDIVGEISAPPLEPEPSTPDKDLPPSYDSLFPPKPSHT